MGIANIINTSTSSGGGGGEIIRELVNSSDGQGLHFDGASSHISIANSAGAEFGTSDFSLEFILNQTQASTDETYYFTAPYTGDNRMGFWYDKANTTLKIYFRATSNVHYAFGYDIAADFGTPTHFVVSADRSGNAVLYRNGTEVASVDISGSSAVNIGDSNANPFYISANAASTAIIGSLYRFRTWNSALTHGEVSTCFQRADVPFESQYGSQTALITGNNSNFASGLGDWATGNNWSSQTNPSNNMVLSANAADQRCYISVGIETKGQKYRFGYDASGVTGTVTLRGWDGSGYVTFGTLVAGTGNSIEFDTSEVTHAQIYIASAASGDAITVDNLTLVQIGCTTDLDLAFANPTQSLMVQDRAGVADGTASASGVSQTQKIPQLNAVAARIGSGAVSPADNELIAGKLTVGDSTSNELLVGFESSSQDFGIGSNGTNFMLGTSATDLDTGNLVTISSAGLVTSTLSSANTNTAGVALKLDHTTSGSSAVGFGTLIRFDGERTGSTSDGMGTIGFVADTMSASRVDGAFVVNCGNDGTYTERLRVSSEGDTTISRFTAGGGTGANTILTLEVDDLPVGTDMQVGDGTRLLFKVPAADTNKVGASIDAIRAQATDADSSTDLRFMVSQNDEILDTAMTIDSAGNVQIGTGTLAAVGGGPTLGICGAAPEITLRDSATNTPYAVMRTNDSGNLYLEADKGDNAGASKVILGSDGADILSFKKETAYVTRGTQEQSAAIAHNTTTTFEAPSNIFMIYDTAGYGATFFNDYSEATVTKIAGATHFTAGGSGAIRLTTAANDSTVTVDNQQGGTRTIKILNLGN